MDNIQPKSNQLKTEELLNTILTSGILPASKLKAAKTSYDEKLNTEVSLNCILKIDGVAQSLYVNPANSSFAVVTEEDVTKQPDGVFAKNFLRLGKSIDNYSSTFPIKFYVKQACLKNVVSQDLDFINDLSEKTHNTALFILELNPQEIETSSLNNFMETKREVVLPDEIKFVLVPKKYREILEKKIPKAIFVESKDQKISISYKDVDKQVYSCETLKEVKVPDYESILTKIANDQISTVSLKEKPIYTHITRLLNE